MMTQGFVGRFLRSAKEFKAFAVSST